MNSLSAICGAVTANFKAMSSHVWQSLVVVVGSACVVGVLVSMLSLTEGLEHSYSDAGDDDRAIVLSQGTLFEFASGLTRDAVATISDMPGIKRNSDGSVVADPEILSSIPVRRKDNSADGAILLRGFGPKGQEIWRKFRIQSGHVFRPGRRELIVGAAAQKQFADVSVGDQVTLSDGTWPIVGSFTSGGSVLEGVLIGDTDTLRATLKRDTYNSVLIKLDSLKEFETLKKSVAKNPNLSASIEMLSEYLRRSGEQFSAFFNAAAYTVSGILSLGATFGIFTTMLSLVDERRIEIATFRAIGFGNFAIIIATLSEALFLSLLGAIIGAGLSWLLIDGQQHIFGNDVIVLLVSLKSIALATLWILTVAVLGAAIPAISAVSRPIAEGFHSK